MNYSHIISDFTWSYSRIKQFEQCPYAFLLHYIKSKPSKRMFFSDYGSFMHRLIERYLKGELRKEELLPEYLTGFHSEVCGQAPSPEVFKSYFDQGAAYLEHIAFPFPKPLAVEQRVNFTIGDKPFTGIIDCIAEDQGLVVLDHKSRTLKPRSTRKKPTQLDKELDEYLRQLYLYSIPIKEQFGDYPSKLAFNCFRAGKLIESPFRKEELDRAEQWALERIDTITNSNSWPPKIEYWKCRYLCDVSDQCAYRQMNERKR